MAMFLNSKIPYESYNAIASDMYFVDKSLLLEKLILVFGNGSRYYCVTRPRRFGKSIMANMVGAFFGKDMDASGLFGNLAIAKSKSYEKHLNKHNMIFIDFSRVLREYTSYKQYVARIQNGINESLS